MRPCPSCGAAVQNNQETCPACGVPTPTKRTVGPPPETGPGISGDPENRREMMGLIAAPTLFSLLAAIIVGVGAVSLWGPWGVFAGLTAGVVSFMAIMLLETL